MKWFKLALGLLGVVVGVLAIIFVLGSEYALVAHPEGIIAQSELDLIILNYLLMLIVVVPTFITLFIIVWKYRSQNSHRAKYEPERPSKPYQEMLLWIFPSIIIAVMAYHTWYATHKLDPFKPLESSVKPLNIQVVALDWKWLFIYPEQGIASVNYFQIPERTPIHLELSSDGTPMNGFWLPQLSGQIYAMSGMVTQLHIMADGPGEYRGRAAEINGEGLADMTFLAKSTSQEDFEAWVSKVKQSPLKLDESVYNDLLKRSIKNPITLYSHVEENLFNKIVMKYMYMQPQTKTAAIWITSSTAD